MQALRDYELFSERTQNLSQRRQLATQTYLSVNTVIFGVFAFLFKDAGLAGWQLLLIGFPLFLAGLAACLVWYRLIIQYKLVIGWHYEQLRTLEQEIPGSAMIYTREWEEFFRPKQKREDFGFARLEAWLPILFFTVYLVRLCPFGVAELHLRDDHQRRIICMSL